MVGWDGSGEPVVIRNDPLLDDGTPMPTRFWLVGQELRRSVDRLEAAGGVRAAEAAVDPAELLDAHRRYARERDVAIRADWPGHRPGGGVGGTRRGVKCLHAHLAWTLAGGDDPVGRWVVGQLGPALVVRIGSRRDIQALQAIERASGALFRSVGLDAVADDDPPSTAALEVVVDAGRCWVAADGTRPVGYVLAGILDDGAHVEQVSILPDVAGRRIGAALLDRVASWAGALGHAEVTLTTFAEVPWNAPYYARLGFTIVPEPAPQLAARLAGETARWGPRHPRVAMTRHLLP